jgi:hypothetical protein
MDYFIKAFECLWMANEDFFEAGLETVDRKTVG